MNREEEGSKIPLDEQLFPLVKIKEQGWQEAVELLERVSPESLVRRGKAIATSAFKNIIGVNLNAQDPGQIEKVARAVGKLIGVTNSLEESNRVLVWSSKIDEETLESSWQVRIESDSYQLTANEAVITPDKANELSMMMFLGEDETIVDLNEWFFYGKATNQEKVLWEETRPRQLIRLNSVTRFELEMPLFKQPDWNSLLRKVEGMKLASNQPDVKAVFPSRLKKTPRRKFTSGLRAFPKELGRFLKTASFVVNSDEKINPAVVLTAFHLRNRVLAIVGKPSGVKKDRNYYNGLWTAAYVSAINSGTNAAQVKPEGEIVYKQGGTFTFKKPVEVFLPVDSEEKDISGHVAVAANLLEKMYSKPHN